MIEEKEKLVTEFQQLSDERKRLEDEIQAHEVRMNRILAPIPTLKSYFQIRDMEESEPPFETLVWEEDPLTGELMPETLLLMRECGEAEEFAEPVVNRLRAAINERRGSLSRLDNEIKLIRVKAAIEGRTLPGDSSALSVKPQESEMKNPRGAGRPRDPEAEKRRNEKFEWLRTLEVDTKEKGAEILRTESSRYQLYDHFVKQKVKMIESDNYSEIADWSDLKEANNGVEDLQATDYLIKDMRRNWDRLWNSQG